MFGEREFPGLQRVIFYELKETFKLSARIRFRYQHEES